MRYGRPPVLRQAEVLAILAAELSAGVNQKHNALLQFYLLLRDSDLRQLRPHHISTPRAAGPRRVERQQQKTSKMVLMPLPSLAAAIWQHYNGVPALSHVAEA